MAALFYVFAAAYGVLLTDLLIHRRVVLAVLLAVAGGYVFATSPYISFTGA